jgi:beta-mannanase
MSNFYPGDDYVDWVGLDGYNYAGSRNMPWYSFRQVFERSYGEVSALAPTKPLMLVESGCDESGGNKAAWILSIKDDLKDRFPKVSAFVWFNQDEGPSKLTIDSSADALKAFGSLVADTYMQGALPR